ncbi:MAG: isochorismatase family protein [Actinomycetota bacterium]
MVIARALQGASPSEDPLIALEELLEHSALITHECQQSVIGESSVLPVLASAAREIIDPVARLAKAARAASVPVVHCVAARRADGAGSNANARLFMAVRKAPVEMLPGSEAVTVVPEIGVQESDLVSTRLHGLSGMSGTDLDPLLRNLGAKTLVVTGVSVNVGILNVVMDAVNLGYNVVLPRDAIAGVPASYANDVIDNTLSLLATLTTSDEVCKIWQR